MTQATERRGETVLAIIKSKAEAEDGYKLELEIPAFESQFPTFVTRVAETLATQLTLGQQYPLLLERQNLKKGKSGSKPYDYYWGLVNIAPARPEGPKQPASEGSPPSLSSVSRERSIERQVAVKAAVDLALGFDGSTQTTEDIILVAYKLAKFMETGEPPSQPRNLEAPAPPIPATGETLPMKEVASDTAPRMTGASFIGWAEKHGWSRIKIEQTLGTKIETWLKTPPLGRGYEGIIAELGATTRKEGEGGR